MILNISDLKKKKKRFEIIIKKFIDSLLINVDIFFLQQGSGIHKRNYKQPNNIHTKISRF